ncbi:NAD(P)-binding domain-containing protein [Sphingobium sp. Sx8-8]|uniref:NADPH-dependent F420 reductase n=1 Tax=Sphingobium sp. Sx8-8 TaxID=2933617 RepID=UPI001F580CD1|nr:NAD(P)-binding domain-containing protein [Sphingobium sp. Sx8-8]
MEIGIIGAGNIGGTLARLFSEAGHKVMIANSRGPDSLRDLADRLGVQAVDRREAARARDLVVLALRPTVIAGLGADLFSETPADTIIVDTGNYYPEARDGRIAGIDEGLPESVWVAKTIGRPVLKAFNSIGAPSLATGSRPKGSKDRIALAVSGDDIAAKEKLMGLLDQIGFDSVDAGPLSQSWRQQPGTLGYCHDYETARLRAALAAANPDHVAHCRAEGDAFAIQLIAMHTGAGRV